ncbi:MAG: hypothetical protein ACPGWR_04920 [Ardenticatenaceae bacterium]
MFRHCFANGAYRGTAAPAVAGAVVLIPMIFLCPAPPYDNLRQSAPICVISTARLRVAPSAPYLRLRGK